MSKCKSCGAEIIWIKTKSGKTMPCDAQAHYYFDNKESLPSMFGHEPGKAVFITEDGETHTGWQDDMAGDFKGYTSHFATCPNASQHRRSK